jgi:serine protease Do
VLNKVTAIFQDDSRHPAKVIGRDEKADIALLKIDTNENLTYVTWGKSDDAEVDDWVVAVGNPFGLGGSGTGGIISAFRRDIKQGPYERFPAKSTRRSAAATPTDRTSIFTAR